jgi:membrane glycosyltransferase
MEDKMRSVGRTKLAEIVVNHMWDTSAGIVIGTVVLVVLLVFVVVILFVVIVRMSAVTVVVIDATAVVSVAA